MESWLFLGLILLVAILGHNMQLIYATIFIMLLKLIPYSTDLFELITAQGMSWGITVISATILVPIATGQINFKDLLSIFSSPAGLIAVLMGIAVALLSKHGLAMLSATPQITVALIFGTIVGVVFLHGVAAGPIIAGGLTYVIISALHLSIS